MTVTKWVWGLITSPWRSFIALMTVLVNLDRARMRALFSVAMLGGMISLSMQNWFYTYLAHQAVEEGEAYSRWFDLILEQTRFNSILIAWFAVIMAAIVFGADWLKLKFGNKELGLGSSKKDEGESE